MTREIINPPSLFSTEGFGFSHIAVQKGGRTVHIAGQTAWDKNQKTVGVGDITAQASQTLANLKEALAAVGATPANIVRLRTYVVNPDENTLGAVVGEITKFYGDAEAAPNTFLGISSLAMPDFMIEIEATAVID